MVYSDDVLKRVMKGAQRALSLAKEDEEDNNDLTEDPFADIRLDLVRHRYSMYISGIAHFTTYIHAS